MENPLKQSVSDDGVSLRNGFNHSFALERPCPVGHVAASALFFRPGLLGHSRCVWRNKSGPCNSNRQVSCTPFHTKRDQIFGLFLIDILCRRAPLVRALLSSSGCKPSVSFLSSAKRAVVDPQARATPRSLLNGWCEPQAGGLPDLLFQRIEQCGILGQVDLGVFAPLA